MIEDLSGWIPAIITGIVAYLTAMVSSRTARQANRSANWAKFHESVEEAVERRVAEYRDWVESRLKEYSKSMQKMQQELDSLEQSRVEDRFKYRASLQHIEALECLIRELLPDARIPKMPPEIASDLRGP